MKRSDELSLMDVFLLIKKNVFKILVVTVVFAIVTGLFTSFFVEVEYTSSMKLVVINKSHEETMTISDVQMSTLLIGDCIELIKSRDLMESIKDSLGIKDISANQLAENIEIDSPTGTRTLDIRVTDNDRIRSKRIADEIYNKGGPLIREKLDVKRVDVIESPVIPTSPSAPNVQRNIILGGFFGMILIIAILIIGKLTNNKLSSSDEIEDELGLTVLASIPKSGVQGRKRAHRQYVSPELKDGSAEGSL